MRLLLLLSVVVLLAGCPKPNTQVTVDGEGGSATTATAGKWTGNAHDFELKNFRGGTMKLSSLAGKPVLLNFWADW